MKSVGVWSSIRGPKQGLHRIYAEINIYSSDLFGCEFHFEIAVTLRLYIIYIYMYKNSITYIHTYNLCSIWNKIEVESNVFFQPFGLGTIPKQRTRDLGPSAMRRRLDIHGLGITALELLCSVAMSSGEEAEVRGQTHGDWLWVTCFSISNGILLLFLHSIQSQKWTAVRNQGFWRMFITCD